MLFNQKGEQFARRFDVSAFGDLAGQIPQKVMVIKRGHAEVKAKVLPVIKLGGKLVGQKMIRGVQVAVGFRLT